MTKIMTLQERGTGVTIYPETSAEAVYCNDGSTVEAKVMKLESEERSNIYAEEPLSPDNFPDIDAYTREELKMDLFIDMWNNAWGSSGGYDAEATDGHPFLGNGLRMTYQEALTIMRDSAGANFLCNYSHPRSTARTFPPIENHRGAFNIDPVYSFFQCRNLEVIDFAGSQFITVTDSTFNACRSLRIIQNGLLVPKPHTFDDLPSLESAQIKVRSDLYFNNSPKLSLPTIEYMIANADNTAPITITLHPDAYARLTEDLIEQAAAKQITFVTL